MEDDDLWFLPGPVDDDLPPGAPPLPMAPRKALFDLGEWTRAQGALSIELARLALVFGELDARLRAAPVGARHALALREAADLSWWTGDRLSLDRLSLWTALRIGSTDDTEQALARAGWAVRRLASGAFPAEGVAAFLDRPADTRVEAAQGPEAGAIANLADLLADAEDLHPVTQSALLFHAWRLLGAPHSRETEAAVLAARHAAQMSRRPGQGALFLPLALTGGSALRAPADPAKGLAVWLAGAEQATLAALLQLDRIEIWHARALTTIADMSGRTPGLLITSVLKWPLITAPLAERETGASRAAVQRNLDILTERGLLREITGQGRYRIWSAAT